MYGYKCEYCPGTVRERLVKKEVFRHKTGFVMLENVLVGICDTCGYRYYHSAILKKAEAAALGTEVPDRTESIPVACLS
jgi:YgiT-type zinc finger domain-containing protein